MRRFLLAAALATATVGTLAVGPASANCEPQYRPLCLNDCMLTIDPHDPIKACPR